MGNYGKKSKVTAGGGVVFRHAGDKVQVLLIHRRGVWDLPKGKIEKGESVEEGSCREVEEETGCRDVHIRSSLGSTRHSYHEPGVIMHKTCWWFAMESGRHDLKPQVEEQIDDLRWVSPETAVKKVGYENLKSVLIRFCKWYFENTGL